MSQLENLKMEKTGLRKMALRKLAYEALKEKQHILKPGYAIRSKVALMPVFIQLMELVFLSRGRQFLSKIPMSVAISGAFFCSPACRQAGLIFCSTFLSRKKWKKKFQGLCSKSLMKFSLAITLIISTIFLPDTNDSK